MKAIILTLTIAAGLVVGLLSTRQPSRAAVRSSESESQPPTLTSTKTSGTSSPGAPTPHLPPGVPRADVTGVSAENTAPHAAYATPAPDPSDSPERRERQAKLWEDLRTFAKDVELTDAQWDHFIKDLMELAEIDAASWERAALPSTQKDIAKLTEELEHDLQVRCASYMNDEQLRMLRFRFLNLVTRTRRVAVAQPPQGPVRD